MISQKYGFNPCFCGVSGALPAVGWRSPYSTTAAHLSELPKQKPEALDARSGLQSQIFSDEQALLKPFGVGSQ
jgi:hypothetical protein